MLVFFAYWEVCLEIWPHVILIEGGGKTCPMQRHLFSAAGEKDLEVALSWPDPREMFHSGGGEQDMALG